MEIPDWIQKQTMVPIEEILEVREKADCDFTTAFEEIRNAKVTNPDEWRKYAIWRAFIFTHTEYDSWEVFNRDVDNKDVWPPYHSTFDYEEI